MTAEVAAARSQDEPRDLGSITRPPGLQVPGTQACLRCGETRLTRLRLTSPGGVDALFVSCPSCEQTHWFAVDGDGEPLDPDGG